MTLLAGWQEWDPGCKKYCIHMYTWRYIRAVVSNLFHAADLKTRPNKMADPGREII